MKFRELKNGTEIIILKQTHEWDNVKAGDKGIVISCGGYNYIDFENHNNWYLRQDVEEGEYFELVYNNFINI